MASGLVTVLACAWQAIKARHDELPSVVLAVGSHRRAAKTICLGHFVPIGWSPVHETEPRELQAAQKEFDDATAKGDLTAALGASAQALLISARQLSEDAKASRSEVFITDDGLCGSPADVLATLLHEAAHAIADRRGIKTTSRQGRYHDARFKVLAEEVGLEVRRDPTIGWSPTTLASPTAAVYSETLGELAQALAHRQEKCPPTFGGRPMECDCGRWVRNGRRSTSKPRAAICGVCGSNLEETATFSGRAERGAT